MNANVNPIYESALARVSDFVCREGRGTSGTEYSQTFVSFIRRGRFGYRVGRKTLDAHGGVVLLGLAEHEYTVTHEHHLSDECTIIEGLSSLFEDHEARDGRRCRLLRGAGAAQRKRPPVCVIPATPRLAHLHALMLAAARSRLSGYVLKTEVLLIALLREVGNVLDERAAVSNRPERVERALLDRHLETVDRAKTFIASNFESELSLVEIARHARVSEFHFCRLFKQLTSLSPHRYLLEVRLSHAALLLRNTSLPVTEICFASGFNSLEHFIATFTRRHGVSPSKFRRGAQVSRAN